MRTQTRKERYKEKGKTAKVFPFSICLPNFSVDENVAFVIRSSACFGASRVNVIGSLPKHDVLVSRSGSTHELIDIQQFSNVHEFLEYIKENNIHLISAELCDDAISIHNYEFPIDKHLCVVVGHETTGVPIEILLNSDKVYIPLNGAAYCLNTSQCANIFLYEMSKRYANIYS